MLFASRINISKHEPLGSCQELVGDASGRLSKRCRDAAEFAVSWEEHPPFMPKMRVNTELCDAHAVAFCIDTCLPLSNLWGG